jgi:hypothetical protein
MSTVVAPEHVAAFLETAPNLFTIENVETGRRFTYRTEPPKNPNGAALFFVEVLTGSNNESDYEYFGSVYKGQMAFYASPKARITAEALSVRGFKWLWEHRAALADFPHVRVHHSGRCGCCGRTLSTPESLARGLGPICAGKRLAA